MKVSVIVPSFNQAAYLRQALDSILAQEGPLEVWVEDGGSTDGSVEILKSYGDAIQWRSSPDGGQAAAINLGLGKATGDILCFLNSDDVWLPGALARVRQAFREHPEARLIYGQAEMVDSSGQVFREYPVEEFRYARLLETCFICQPACFWRREVYARHGGLDERLVFNLDYEYWLRIGRRETFWHLPEKLAQTRFHADAKTVKDKVKIHLEALSMLEQYSPGKPARNWLRGYARSRGDEAAGGFWEYAREYGRGTEEMRQRYHLGIAELGWIYWKLWGSYKLRNRGSTAKL